MKKEFRVTIESVTQQVVVVRAKDEDAAARKALRGDEGEEESFDGGEELVTSVEEVIGWDD